MNTHMTMDIHTTTGTPMNTNRLTERIKLWGIVQGVGFRPFVAKVAHRMGMKGEVLNIGGLVEIEVTDTRERIDAFVKAIERDKPVPAEIVHIKRTPEPFREFDRFTILDSDSGDDEAAMIPADLSICPHCLSEMRDPDNPRYRHPFISCMVCGPRYTIIDRIPYDRDNTTMIDFPMCDFCEEEYTDLHDRRYHAQTISCHSCGPVLSMSVEEGAQLLAAGEVIAFKSMGGYNLICDPLNDQAVRKLREIKKREQKPFAVMFRDMEQIREFCYVSPMEEKLLASSAKPILLLEHKPSDSKEIQRSRFIGSFLPSMGAQHLLLDEISPLIVTSANLSEMPIIKDDEEMRAMMEREPLIKGVISNKRRIQVRVDDSVVRAIDGQPQMIRRSKGYAPVPLYVKTEYGGQILATGGQLKNSFALSKGPFVYMSQYFGDMDSVENQKIYEENVERMADLFRIKPELVVCDLHPLYYTSAYAQKLGLPVLQVQHHHAHVASVMAEHDLAGKVIGVSFDGTGYGTDGAIWGGEFLLCEGGEFRRADHLRYVKMLGGDSSMKEGWKSAVSYLYAWENGYREQGEGIAIDLSDIIEFAKERSWPGEELARKAIAAGINTIESSSMGRLFDGVSALLGIKDRNDYEGQCAILLEDAAANPEASAANALALEFHKRIARVILDTCIRIREESGARQVALTGGVFQNKILMEESLALLRRNDFIPYYNVSVSPNDGGIALGQAYIALRKKEADHGN
ncbi:carbamoyltransferase HypF [Anaerovorax odorimutans]|nr:carbamoyltransferase HypF [Anaerovorax odorimutans]